MTYLAIDLGDKKCGLAKSVEGIAVPLKIVKRVELVKELKKIIKELNTKIIFIGLPYDLIGQDKKQLNKTLKFKEKLEDIFTEIKVVGVDERYSSKNCELGIMNYKGNGNNLKTKNGKLKTFQIDDISACLILESGMRIIENKK